MKLFERIRCGALLLAIIVPAWWLGASTPGGQWALLVFATVACAAGWVAKRDGANSEDGDEPVGRAGRMGGAGRWCAVSAGLFLGWILVQVLNPSHGLFPSSDAGLTTVGNVQAQLGARPHVAWLPSGLATPFARLAGYAMPHENAARQLLIFGGVALLGAAFVGAVDRVARVRTILGIGAVQAAAFSAVALAYNLSGSVLTYWKYFDPVYRLGGPQFPHDNQQVAYQVLLLAVALAACLARGELAPFGPTKMARGWLIAAVVVTYAGTVTCRPRSGLLLGTLLVAGSLGIKAWMGRPERRRLVAWAALGGVVALGVALVTVEPLRGTMRRFRELANPRLLLTGGSFRPIQHKVAMLAFEDRPWLGWGGGSYLYLSPDYAQRVPELMQALRDQGQNHRPIFAHADGDWVEFLVEYGVIGVALFAGVVAGWGVWVLRRIRRLGTVEWVLSGGVLLVLAQGMIDPVLRNPVVLGATVMAAWLVVVVRSEEELAEGRLGDAEEAGALA